MNQVKMSAETVSGGVTVRWDKVHCLPSECVCNPFSSDRISVKIKQNKKKPFVSLMKPRVVQPQGRYSSSQFVQRFKACRRRLKKHYVLYPRRAYTDRVDFVCVIITYRNIITGYWNNRMNGNPSSLLQSSLLSSSIDFLFIFSFVIIMYNSKASFFLCRFNLWPDRNR